MANILIVGANQGIGYYLVKRLLELNHFVAVLDIDINNLAKLQETYPTALLPIAADARYLSSVQQGVEKAIGQFKSLDVAIHNACLCTFESEPSCDYEYIPKSNGCELFWGIKTGEDGFAPYAKKQEGTGYIYKLWRWCYRI